MTATRRALPPAGALLAWAVPAAVACGLVAVYVLGNLPGLTGDTIALVHGAHTITYCLGHGIHHDCDRLAQFVPGSAAAVAQHRVVEGAVAPYPLFQYIPALVLEQLGMGDATIYQAFSVISLVAFCATIALAAWLGLRTRRGWAAPVTIVVVTASPLLYYAWLTFGESLAALLMMGLAATALRRAPPLLIALTALLACLTKETAFPLVALIGAAGLWATTIGREPLRRAHWTSLAAGIAAGVAVSAAFDWFRYGQLTNYTYGHAYEQVPGVLRRLGISVALWVAPNGGVTWFWPLATVAAVALVAVTVAGPRLPGRPARLPAVALVAALLLLTGTLASWYAPFGWVAWGPRLMMPIVPAIVVTAIVVYRDALEGLLRTMLTRPAGLVITATVVIACGLPEINVLHAPQVPGQLFNPDATCPTPANVGIDPSYYYHCLSHWAWESHSVLVSTFVALDGLPGVIFAVAFAAIWGWLLVLARLRFSAPAPRSP